jgi:hypothetical protein
MIKVWILMVFLTMPTLNTVRYMGELTYSLEDCELRASLKTGWMEEWAHRTEVDMYDFDVQCIETKMFNPNPAKDINWLRP